MTPMLHGLNPHRMHLHPLDLMADRYFGERQPGEKRIPPQVAAQLAEHLTEESLTELEIEVLRRVSAGHSNKVIADELAPSEHTVKRASEKHSFKTWGKRSYSGGHYSIARGLLEV